MASLANGWVEMAVERMESKGEMGNSKERRDTGRVGWRPKEE